VSKKFKQEDDSEISMGIDAEDILDAMSNETQNKLMENLFFKSQESLTSEDIQRIAGIFLLKNIYIFS
jgi:hypothetical protein